MTLVDMELLCNWSRDEYTKNPSPSMLIQYITCMTLLKQKQELFYLSHQLTSAQPHEASSWYCVGCYYWVISKMDSAQKFLKKAIKKNKEFSAAYILLGHVFSMLEENEQSLASFRSAVRHSSSSHIPLLCIGKELMRNGNYWLSAHTLNSARQLHPTDLSVLNELGVVIAKLGKLNEALEYFEFAIESLQSQTQQDVATVGTWIQKPDLFTSSITSELLFNFATVLRKLSRLTEAIFWYKRCLSVSPTRATVLASIGFTLHLDRRFAEAVVYYHQALSLQPKYTFCTELLNQAMEDHFKFESNDSVDGNATSIGATTACFG